MTTLIATLQRHSRFLQRRLAQYPAWAERLSAEAPYRTAKPRKDLLADLAQWRIEAADLNQALRRMKGYELARIGWRDWIERAPIEALLADWSTVADVLIAAAYDALTPSDDCVLIALGKLGSSELNISSDIDLLLLYDDTKKGDESGAQIAPAVARHLTQCLTQPTADGFVFRVDWDLRPEGRQGPAAIGIEAALRYYEERGAEWERMMLLRARPVAGHRALGARWIAELAPFMYRRHTSIATLETLRQMKTSLARDVRDVQHHIKCGAGGIREAEFVTHAFQLLHGGHHPTLQTPSTFGALAQLEQLRLLPAAQTRTLRTGYAFLRHVEHELQIDDDRQIHTLPATDTAWERLARQMDPDATDPLPTLIAQLTHHRAAIHTIFARLFAVPYAKAQLTEALEEALAQREQGEDQVEGIGHFKQRQYRRLVPLDLSREQSFSDVCRQLTLLAEVIIDAVYRMAYGQCLARFGVPRIEGSKGEVPFAILALGSCGAEEMDFGSDLDLLFLYGGHGTTDGKHPMAAAEFFARLGQKIIALLRIRLRTGLLYPVDVDLRPSGNFGVLVCTVEAFERYHREDAALWEHQALLRARPVVGDHTLLESLGHLCQTLPFEHAFPRDAAVQMRRLRQRMEEERAHESATLHDLKYGPGGIADIEGIAQLIQLRHGGAHAELRIGNTWRVLAAAAGLGHLTSEQAAMLASHFTWMRRLLGHYRLITQTTGSQIDAASEAFASLCHHLALGSVSDVQQEIAYRRTAVRACYETMMVDE